jgi:hypothetical protein
MPDFDSTREFHDELLSAYLDGELSPAERARVEERLVVDPVARQMLDELRSVSEAMQGLPRQDVGEDLSGAILSLAEQSRRSLDIPTEAGAAAIGASSNGDEPAAATVTPRSSGTEAIHQLPIGRTRRGWVWAGLAVAAALLIMFVNRDAERDAGLPQVASRQRLLRQSERGEQAAFPELQAFDDDAAKVADLERTRARSDAGGRSFNEIEGVSATPATPATPLSLNEPKTIALEERGTAGRDFADTATGAQMPMSGALAGAGVDKPVVPADELAQEKFAAIDAVKRSDQSGNQSLDLYARQLNESIATGTAVGGGEGRPTDEVAMLGMPTTRGELSSAAPPRDEGHQLARSDLLVVHVNVKREALVRRAIDQKLASHQIVLDAMPAAAAAAPPAANEFRRADAEVDSDYYLYLSQLPASEREVQQTDMLLVEAPPARVEQLLADLDADADNVVSISINQAGSAGRSAGESASADVPSQSANLNWTRFKRIAVAKSLREASSEQPALAKQLETTTAAPSSSSIAMGGGGRGGGGAAAGRGGRRGRGGAMGGVRGRSTEGDDQPAAQSDAPTSRREAVILDAKDRNGQVSAESGTPSRAEEQAESRFGGRSAEMGDVAINRSFRGMPAEPNAEAKQMQLGRARRLSTFYGVPPNTLNRFYDVAQPAGVNSTPESQMSARVSMPQSQSGLEAREEQAAQSSDFSRFGGGGAAPAGGKTDISAKEPVGRGAQVDGLGSYLQPPASTSPTTRVRDGTTIQVLFVFRAEPDSAAASSERAAPATTSPPPANPPK